MINIIYISEIYQKEMVEGEKEERHNKKREKKIKFDINSFKPINPQIFKTCKYIYIL